MIPATILDLDVSEILQKLEKRYHVKLPRKVVALDYGAMGDLYIRFEHVEKPVGEATEDGLVVFLYREETSEPVAVEIMDITQLA
ncbi:MAG: hypothetical protein JRN20_02470 [Nitrososphaerota archaeon]|nr:hypothetical protein [Nitrososphaerota archaeon]